MNQRSGLLAAIALLFTVQGFPHTLHNPDDLPLNHPD